MRKTSNPFSLRRAVLLLFVIGGAGCGEGSDPSPGPPAIPNVAGNYTISTSVPAVTCTPSQPPSGGTVILEAFSQSYAVRIEQTGGVIRLIEVAFPDEPFSGTINAAGEITIVDRFTFREAPRAGNRVFFVDLTGTYALTLDKSTGRITGTVGFVNVFHEGSPSAPIYTTCSRQGGTATFTRTN